MRTFVIILCCILIISSSVHAQSSALSSSKTAIPLQPQSFAWTQVDIGATQTLNDLFFLNKDTGWVAGDQGLFSTTDRGVHWTLSALSGQCQQVQFIDALNGWTLFLSQSNDVLHTTNGGATWQPEHSVGSGASRRILFVNRDTGYGCLGEYITKTTNGGATWSEQHVDASSLEAFGSPGYPYAYCVGNTAVWHGQFNKPFRSVINYTSDGGLNWTRLEYD